MRNKSKSITEKKRTKRSLTDKEMIKLEQDIHAIKRMLPERYNALICHVDPSLRVDKDRISRVLSMERLFKKDQELVARLLRAAKKISR